MKITPLHRKLFKRVKTNTCNFKDTKIDSTKKGSIDTMNDLINLGVIKLIKEKENYLFYSWVKDKYLPLKNK